MRRMKITAIDTCLLSVPTPKPMALQYPEHKLVVAEIATDEGLRGLGYSLVFNGGGAEAVLTYLDTRLKPALLGEDPLFVERLWEKMFRVDMGIKKQGIAAYALSALDIGLWDIAGKAAELPLYKLWGAVSDRIGAYGSGGWAKYSVDELIAEAEKYAGLGCKYYKMKIHHPDPAVNASRVAAVTKALGSGVRMMVDVNQGRDVIGNQRQARLLEEFDLLWYEEPVLADDYDGYAEVARSIRIPIAGEGFEAIVLRPGLRHLHVVRHHRGLILLGLVRAGGLVVGADDRDNQRGDDHADHEEDELSPGLLVHGARQTIGRARSRCDSRARARWPRPAAERRSAR